MKTSAACTRWARLIQWILPLSSLPRTHPTQLSGTMKNLFRALRRFDNILERGPDRKSCTYGFLCIKKKKGMYPAALSCTFHVRRPLAAPHMIRYKLYPSFIVMCHSVGKPLCFRLRHVPRETVGTSQAAKRPTCLPRNIFFPHHLVLIQISRNASEPRHRLKVRIPPQMHHYQWHLSLRRVIPRRLWI